MKFLQKVASLPQELEANVLYLNSTDGSVVLKKAEPVPPTPTVEVVDLGLPSGTKWMKYNIGTTSEEEAGLYFQWGDTVGRTADEVNDKPCSWETTPWGEDATPMATLDADHDAAYVATNGVAYTPTLDDINELLNNTNSAYTQINNVNGIKFSSKNDAKKYIFMPSVGYCYGYEISDNINNGYYWSNSIDSNPKNALGLKIEKWYPGQYISYRCYGYTVRGVVSK